MSKQKKSLVRRLSASVRKFIAPSVSELSRAGRIARTLWDAAQLQKKEQKLYQALGELTRNKALGENDKMPIEVQRLIAKLEYNEHVLKRLDRRLKSYQMRSDSPVELEDQNTENTNRHQPV